jgi:RNA polymerase sigma-70 factor (ECF subfamily)
VRILINACHDINRKQNGLLHILENTDIGRDNNVDLNLTLEKSIQMLPLKMRECFILFAIEGFKQNEISEMLDISEGTVKAHIFQAKAKLREMIKNTV